jgi:hypothetical protein
MEYYVEKMRRKNASKKMAELKYGIIKFIQVV